MPEGYHHPDHGERCRIQVLLKRGLSKREIAREPGWEAGTVSRETCAIADSGTTSTDRPRARRRKCAGLESGPPP